MGVIYFKVNVIGTEEKLSSIKLYFDSQINIHDLDNTFHLTSDLIFLNEIYYYIVELIINGNVPINKYKNLVTNYFNLLDKTDLTIIEAVQADERNDGESLVNFFYLWS